MTEPGRRLVVGGYAVLNVFVETGSEDQPIVDTAGIQVCTESVVVANAVKKSFLLTEQAKSTSHSSQSVGCPIYKLQTKSVAHHLNGPLSCLYRTGQEKAIFLK